jgi:hypothetical protein
LLSNGSTCAATPGCEAAEAYEALHQMEVMNGADQGGRSHHGGGGAGGSKVGLYKLSSVYP